MAHSYWCNRGYVGKTRETRSTCFTIISCNFNSTTLKNIATLLLMTMGKKWKKRETFILHLCYGTSCIHKPVRAILRPVCLMPINFTAHLQWILRRRNELLWLRKLLRIPQHFVSQVGQVKFKVSYLSIDGCVIHPLALQHPSNISLIWCSKVQICSSVHSQPHVRLS